MAAQVDLKPTIDFLKALKRNNNRAWFQAHRSEFEQASSRFEAFVGALIDELRPTEDLRGLTPKDCIFRIYRDVRFSRDKTPYKTHMGAYVAPGGRKLMRVGYYVQVSPGDDSMLAGGLHDPDPKQLDKFRQAISRDAAPFKKIVGARAFRQYFGDVEGDKLKSAPRGYSKDHPEIELLRMKQVTVYHGFTDSEVLASDIVKRIVSGCKLMKPFLIYLDSVR
jgi:uncharacterized protein (TIGR02453 family)